MNRSTLSALVVCVALAGCKQKAEPAPAASVAPPAATPAAYAPPAAPSAAATAAATGAPAQPASAPAAATPSDIPTSEDFEQQALDEINPQNMEQELDKLEKDIGK